MEDRMPKSETDFLLSYSTIMLIQYSISHCRYAEGDHMCCELKLLIKRHDLLVMGADACHEPVTSEGWSQVQGCKNLMVPKIHMLNADAM